METSVGHQLSSHLEQPLLKCKSSPNILKARSGRSLGFSIIVIAANRHDVTQLEPVLDGLVVRRPRVGPRAKQHLCADAAFQGASAERAICRRYLPHVRSRREEHRARKRQPARRWLVEVAHSWFNRFRKLLVRYEKTHRSYLALTMLAAAIISFRHVPTRVNIIDGQVLS
jgi:transposase